MYSFDHRLTTDDGVRIALGVTSEGLGCCLADYRGADEKDVGWQGRLH